MTFGSERETSQNSSVQGRDEKRRARLAAVQALYQMDMTQEDLNKVLADFILHRFGDADIYSGTDQTFFQDIIRGVATHQAAIDNAIARHLAEGWKLSRIDSILRAVLRSAVFELMNRAEIPARVILNEYVELARDFFSGDEPGVVNGVLDRVAREARRGEFGRKATKPRG